MARLPALAMLVAALAWACDAGAERPASGPAGAATNAAAADSARSPWELAYERVVSGNQDLYAAPAGGGPERRLTVDPGTDGLPRFSRDGRRLLFSSDRSGNWQVWEMPAEGGPARRLRANRATEWQADESPDGGSVALLSNLDGAESLWLVARPGGAARRLVRHGRDTILGNPHWSPDGRSIVFSSNWRLPGHRSYVLDLASGKERRISPLSSGACEPRFSPDGRKVVYVRRHHLTRERSRLVETDLGSGDERVLVEWPALNYDPVYSPDGSELAFASTIAGDYAIYRQRLADGRAWRVSFGPGPARYPDYRPAPR